MVRRCVYIVVSLFVATAMSAQNVWEKPKDDATVVIEKEDKSVKNVVKDAKYLAGALTEKNGKIVWTTDISLPGWSADEIYNTTFRVMQELTKEDNQLEGSTVSIVNKKEHIIVSSPREWLTFTSKFLWLDRAEMYYTLIATCSDGLLHLSMERIKFLYAENGKDKHKILAEEAISDKNGLNKKKTKLVPGWAKFRKKTIDRKDEIFCYIENKVKAKLK